MCALMVFRAPIHIECLGCVGFEHFGSCLCDVVCILSELVARKLSKKMLWVVVDFEWLVLRADHDIFNGQRVEFVSDGESLDYIPGDTTHIDPSDLARISSRGLVFAKPFNEFSVGVGDGSTSVLGVMRHFDVAFSLSRG